MDRVARNMLSVVDPAFLQCGLGIRMLEEKTAGGEVRRKVPGRAYTPFSKCPVLEKDRSPRLSKGTTPRPSLGHTKKRERAHAQILLFST